VADDDNEDANDSLVVKTSSAMTQSQTKTSSQDKDQDRQMKHKTNTHSLYFIYVAWAVFGPENAISEVYKKTATFVTNLHKKGL